MPKTITQDAAVAAGLDPLAPMSVTGPSAVRLDESWQGLWIAALDIVGTRNERGLHQLVESLLIHRSHRFLQGGQQREGRRHRIEIAVEALGVQLVAQFVNEPTRQWQFAFLAALAHHQQVSDQFAGITTVLIEPDTRALASSASRSPSRMQSGT